MGKRNRTAVITYWAPLLNRSDDGRALAVAYCIADAVPDGEDEFWGGQRLVAEWLGVWSGKASPFDDARRQVARRALQRLVSVRLLEQITPPSPRSPGTYRCHWKEPPVWPADRPP